MIVVDSSVWIDYFNNVRTQQTDALDALLENERASAGDLILAEVLQGFRSNRGFWTALSLFDAVPIFSMVGRDLAVASAANYRKLRARGVAPRKTIDVIIATFCIEGGHPLLHTDRDFDAMRDHLGLRTI